MRSPTIVTLLVLIGALAPGTSATTGDGVTPHKKWAIVSFVTPTRVMTEILVGPYLVVHDDARMLQGEPCTSLYAIEAHRGREAAVSFHCIPRTRPAVGRFTITTEWDDALGMHILTEYQFAGDAEGHAVPIAWAAAARLPVRARVTCVR